MDVEVTVRPAGLRYEDFRDLDEICFPDEPASREYFEMNADSGFWAMRGDRLLGYGFLRRQDDPAWIARVGVDPGERNRGVGRLVMEAMLARCRESRARSVILYVRQDNLAAIHLYEKLGFVRSDVSFQYLVPTERLEAPGTVGRERVEAVPVTEVPVAARPVFPGVWADMADAHEPPKCHVLLFRDESENLVGYCRLAPGFPGSFPFELDRPEDLLAGAIANLRPLLIEPLRPLKLTFANPAVAKACDLLGLPRNYTLFQMTLDLPEA